MEYSSQASDSNASKLGLTECKIVLMLSMPVLVGSKSQSTVKSIVSCGSATEPIFTAPLRPSNPQVPVTSIKANEKHNFK